MIIPVSVKNQSIDSSGITSDYKAAISEYIWNGFEANAKKVSIEYTLNEAFGVKELIIKDNGDRVGVITNEGKFLPCDYYMILIIRDIIDKVKNKTFLYDVKCSKSLEDEIIKLGGILI